jgi:hypothetical protein
MSTRKSLGIIMAGWTTIMLLIGAGCSKTENVAMGPTASRHDPNYSHNLAHVRCNKQNGGGRIDIEVSVNDDALADDDRVVFLCEGEKARWFTNNSNLKFVVDFKDKATAVHLFTSHDTTLTWDPDNPQSGLSNETKTEVVDTVNLKEPVDYNYSIDIFDRQGHLKKHVDPHIIPVGN